MDARIRRHHVDSLDDPVLPITKRGKALLCDPLLKGYGLSRQ